MTSYARELLSQRNHHEALSIEKAVYRRVEAGTTIDLGKDRSGHPNQCPSLVGGGEYRAGALGVARGPEKQFAVRTNDE